MVTPLIYEGDAYNLAGILVGSKILPTDKLKNGALVTPTTGIFELNLRGAHYNILYYQ